MNLTTTASITASSMTEHQRRVRLGVRALEMLHVELEDDFETLYRLTGNETFRRASETLHSAPHPLTHQGIPQ